MMTSMEKHKTAQHNEHTSQTYLYKYIYICYVLYYNAILLNTSAFVPINIKTPYTQQRTFFFYIYKSQTKQRYFESHTTIKAPKKKQDENRISPSTFYFTFLLHFLLLNVATTIHIAFLLGIL